MRTGLPSIFIPPHPATHPPPCLVASFSTMGVPGDRKWNSGNLTRDLGFKEPRVDTECCLANCGLYTQLMGQVEHWFTIEESSEELPEAESRNYERSEADLYIAKTSYYMLMLHKILLSTKEDHWILYG
eukprot:scaffold215586_cov54-Attheya_sp.AAC.1